MALVLPACETCETQPTIEKTVTRYVYPPEDMLVACTLAPSLVVGDTVEDLYLKYETAKSRVVECQERVTTIKNYVEKAKAINEQPTTPK